MHHDQELDTRGLNCPLPILRAKKALGAIQSGEVLKIVATDPGSVRDFQAFSKQTGHALLSHGEANGEFTFLLQKK
jgi:tRNA 2-thiouridine synthesizing protein A